MKINLQTIIIISLLYQNFNFALDQQTKISKVEIKEQDTNQNLIPNFSRYISILINSGHTKKSIFNAFCDYVKSELQQYKELLEKYQNQLKNFQPQKQNFAKIRSQIENLSIKFSKFQAEQIDLSTNFDKEFIKEKFIKKFQDIKSELMDMEIEILTLQSEIEYYPILWELKSNLIYLKNK